MIDWTLLTNDPNDKAVSIKIKDYLESIKIVKEKGKAIDFILSEIVDKVVLDIGICEHSLNYIESDSWKHNKIRSAAREVIGIDILDDLVNHLNRLGYSVLKMDATSETENIGKVFDAIVIGDVIEHVENPIAMLRFAKRHLSKGGKVYISTPNPHYIGTFVKMQKNGIYISNLEHLFWVSPSMALEMARRAKLSMVNYVCFVNKSKILKSKLLHGVISELYSEEYLYVFEVNK